MSRCLIDIKEEVNWIRQFSDHLDPEKIEAYDVRYDEIVEDGLERNPPPQKEPGKRGRVKQSPPKNLLDRLQEHKQEVLAFMHDFSVPFDNNQAERDVRMMKVNRRCQAPSELLKGRMCSVVFVGISLQRGRTGVVSSMLFTMRLEGLHLFPRSVLPPQ